MREISPEDFLDLFSNPDVERSLDENPFVDIMAKYARVEDKYSAEFLDDIAIELETSFFLKELEIDLSAAPRYTGLYRYDAYSLDTIDTFAGPMPKGPSTAWLRVFKDLTFDKIKVLRTENEAMVIIDHPSVLASSHDVMTETTEPTVLFTSRLLQAPEQHLDPQEDNVTGLVLKHGQTPSSINPGVELQNQRVIRDAADYALEQLRKYPRP